MKRLSFFVCLLLCAGACQSDPYRDGELLYKAQCASCHMDQGEGLGELIPPLAGSDYLVAHRHTLPCIVRYGLSDTITVNGRVFSEKMDGLPHLSDIEITNILNYVNTRWGNQGNAFTLEEVRQILEDCPR